MADKELENFSKAWTEGKKKIMDRFGPELGDAVLSYIFGYIKTREERQELRETLAREVAEILSDPNTDAEARTKAIDALLMACEGRLLPVVSDAEKGARWADLDGWRA